jgi:hypothetical protein
MTTAQIEQRKRRFLERFATCGNVSTACKQAAVGRTTVYAWQEHDEAFLAAYRQAELAATEYLEEVALTRAVEGQRRLKFTKEGNAILDPATGEPYTEQHTSDLLLIFLLKARAPEKYRERLDITRVGEPTPKVYAGVSLDDL